MADQDNDMKANKEEFTAFLHPEEYDHMKDIVVLVRDTLTKVLHTETNWISSLSFLTMYFFFFFFFFKETMEDIDKNGDGLIDLDEYIGEFWQPTSIIISLYHTIFGDWRKQTNTHIKFCYIL